MFAWEINFKTDTIVWAENAAAVIGCLPDELSDKSSNGNFFVHPDERARVIAEFQTFCQTGSNRFEMEFRGVPRNGKPMFWRTAGKILRDANGALERANGVTHNVTRHVEATALVRLLDERLSTAEESSGVLVYDWDVRENLVWRSHNLTRIFGWEIEDLKTDYQAWENLTHPRDNRVLSTADLEVFLTKHDHFTREYRARHKQGHYIWVMDTGRVFRDSLGAIIRVAGTIIDMTSRKKAEQTQQRMASLIDLSFEPILVWHPERGILEWNRGAESIYGFTREQALNHNARELLHTRYPVSFAEIMEQLNLNRNWTGEIENKSRDGTSVVVESRYQLIDFEEETLVLETNRDVRERRRADANVARMAAVAGASHDALYGANLDGIIETWNFAAEKLLGYSEAEILNHHISAIAHPDQHAEQLQFIAKVAAGETVGPFDTVRKTQNGKMIDVSIAISPVKAADGTVSGLSVALRDIGYRKEWEQGRLIMNRELAHRVKNSFAVLQAILRSTLKSTPDPEQFAAAFSGRLNSMAAAHDVLTANDWRGVEIGALLRHQLAHYVTTQRIRLRGDMIELAPEHATPLSLIFNELANNALKFGALSTPNGRIDVSWNLQSSQHRGGMVDLTWVESGGPKVEKIGPRGFGSTLIEKSLGNSKVEIDFRADGLACKLSWPAQI